MAAFWINKRERKREKYFFLMRQGIRVSNLKNCVRKRLMAYFELGILAEDFKK